MNIKNKLFIYLLVSVITPAIVCLAASFPYLYGLSWFISVFFIPYFLQSNLFNKTSRFIISAIVWLTSMGYVYYLYGWNERFYIFAALCIAVGISSMSASSKERL